MIDSLLALETKLVSSDVLPEVLVVVEVGPVDLGQGVDFTGVLSYFVGVPPFGSRPKQRKWRSSGARGCPGTTCS